MENKAFIRQCLLDNRYGIYSQILDTYREQLNYSKTPSLFRCWLAAELDISIEKINLNSLNSALKRQRKQNKKNKQEQPRTDPPQPASSQKDIGGFKFSKPGSDDEKQSRIREW